MDEHVLYQGLRLGGYQLESGRDGDHKRPGEDRWGKEEMRTTENNWTWAQVQRYQYRDTW